MRYSLPMPFTRTAGAVLFCIASAVGCPSRGQDRATQPPNVPASASTDSVVRHHPLGALYFGVSRRQIAWLVSLDPGTRSGLLYEPLGTVSLCDIRLDSTGTLSFQSAVGFWAYYRFAGRLDQSSLDGVILVVRERAHSPADSFHVALTRIPISLPQQEDSQAVSGLYSDVWYHEGTGDLLGQEVILLQTAQGLSAATILYEGSPDWPTAADSVGRVGDTLTLWQREPWHRGPPPDRAVLRHDTLSFRDGPQLPKKASLGDLFARPPRFRCS